MVSGMLGGHIPAPRFRLPGAVCLLVQQVVDGFGDGNHFLWIFLTGS